MRTCLGTGGTQTIFGCQISSNDEAVYWSEMSRLAVWCKDNNLNSTPWKQLRRSLLTLFLPLWRWGDCRVSRPKPANSKTFFSTRQSGCSTLYVLCFIVSNQLISMQIVLLKHFRYACASYVKTYTHNPHTHTQKKTRVQENFHGLQLFFVDKLSVQILQGKCLG